MYGLGSLAGALVLGVGLGAAMTWPEGPPLGFLVAVAAIAAVPFGLGWCCRYVLTGE